MRLTYNLYQLFDAAFSAYLEGVTSLDFGELENSDIVTPIIRGFIINGNDITFTVEDLEDSE